MSDGIPKHIECLKGQSSYRIWSVQIKSILNSKGLWPYVIGKYSEPDSPEEGETKKSFNERLRDYTIDKAKAAGILQQSLSKDIILDVEFIEDPKDIWLYLKSKYEPSGLAHQFSMYQDWQAIHYYGKDLEGFIHKYTQACSRPKESKVNVSDTIKLYQFITIISPWFENFTAGIRDKLRGLKEDKELPSLDDIISNLLDENKAQTYNQVVNYTRNDQKISSAPTKGKEKISENSSGNQRPSCGHCGSAHLEKKCWHLNPQRAPKSFKPKPCNVRGCKLSEYFAETNSRENSNIEPNKPNRNFLSRIPTDKSFMARLTNQESSTTASRTHISAPSISDNSLKALLSSESSESWILDSGASTHFTHDIDCMIDYQACDVNVEFGKGSAKALAYGSIQLNVIGDQKRKITFSDVYYVPDMRANLLSTEKLRNKGLFYRNDKQVLFTKNSVIANIYSHQGIPHVQLANHEVNNLTHVAMSSYTLPNSKATADIWHSRFGHLPEEKIKQALKVTKGMIIDSRIKLRNCHSCKEATSKRIISRIKSPRPEEPLTHWNIDVVTISPESIGRARYFTLMTDAASLVHRVGFHSSKDGAFVHIQKLVNYVKTNTGTSIKVLHVDGGREYGGIKLTEICSSNGIALRITTPHNSEQNGRAETSNHYICTVARKMMVHGKVPMGLWTEAVEAAVYIINLTPSTTLGGISPYQRLAEYFDWDPKIPYVGNLRVYGCKAFVYDHDVKRGNKFMSKALVGKLVGFEGHNVYRIWLPNKHKVVRSTNVRFDEECIESNNLESPVDDIELDLMDYDTHPHPEDGGDQSNSITIDASGGDTDSSDESSTDDTSGANIIDDQYDDFENELPSLSTAGTPSIEILQEPRRSSRTKKQSLKGIEHNEYKNQSSRSVLLASFKSKPKFAQPKSLPHRAFVAFTNSIDTTEVKTPNHYKEAILSPQKAEWLNAMREELDSLKENEVWELVSKNKVKGPVIEGQWVFKLKLGAGGIPVKFKA